MKNTTVDSPFRTRADHPTVQGSSMLRVASAITKPWRQNRHDGDMQEDDSLVFLSSC